MAATYPGMGLPPRLVATRWWISVAGGLCLTALAAPASAQRTHWEALIANGSGAFQEGRYEDAKRAFQDAVAEAERSGPQDPRVGESLNDLADVYRVEGAYPQAEPLYQRALAIREKSLGPEQPDVALVLNNLGEVYYAQKKYASAEPLFQRALAIWEKSLGPDHPYVAVALTNYAGLLRRTNRAAEAERFEARAKAIQSKQH